jgi:hypothetical protein
MNSIYTLGTSSASHTYGNVASCVKEMLLQYFPKGFFTYTYVDSKIAWKNIAEVLGNGTTEFKKRHYPFMIVTPRFNTLDNDRYLGNIPLTTNMDYAITGLRRNTLFALLMDKAHHMELAYRMNRDSVDFEVELRLKSLVQQLDTFKNMTNQMLWNIPHLKPAALESMIPKSMIEYVGKIAGIDITASTPEHNQVPLIMRYLNAHSKMPITYKVRNSTAVEEFFAYYKTKLLLTFSDLSMEEGNKKNAVDEYYSIRFKVTAEFNLPGLYALIGTHEKQFHGLKFDAMVTSQNGGVEMIPMYTYTNLYDRYDVDHQDGFQFYSSTIVQSDQDRAGQDETIAMGDVIPEDHMKILERIMVDNIPPETLFRFRMLKNSHEIMCNGEQGEACPAEWDIDWKRRRITIHDSDPLVTYRLVIYANMVQLNQRYMTAQDLPKRDKASL